MASEQEKGSVTPSTSVLGFDAPSSSRVSSDVPRWTPKAASIERRKSMQVLESLPTDKGSPWRVLPKSPTSIAAINAEVILQRSQAINPPPSSANPSGLTKSLNAHEPSAPRYSPTLPSPLQLPASGLGPVIIPVRSVSTAHVPLTKKKKAAGGEAWTRPPPAPPMHVPRGTSASMLDIQRQEQEQQEATKVRKTLREIQEEEEERRVQQDFERWWSMEEARLREEEELMLAKAKAVSVSTEPAAETRAGRGRRGGRPRPKKRSSDLAGGDHSELLQPTPAIPIERPDLSQGSSGRPRPK